MGGHGAALHAVEAGLRVAVMDGNDVGGTCVNRGCVPSKALLAASGRVREMREAHHLKQMGVTARLLDSAVTSTCDTLFPRTQVGSVSYDREGVAAHARGLATTIRGNLRRSLEALGVVRPCAETHAARAAQSNGTGHFKWEWTVGWAAQGAHSASSLAPGRLTRARQVAYGLPGRVDVGGEVSAKDIIIATGSVPFVPPGITVDGKTVFTSDHALKLDWVPEWVGIIGSGCGQREGLLPCAHLMPSQIHRSRVFGCVHGAGERRDVHRGTR